MSAVLEVRGLRKNYRSVFLMRSVPAVHDVSFSVEEGHVFGFLGPNGAGKTTTIRVLMDLISATAGEVRMFGKPAPSRESRGRIGFLPESPYFYDYLTVTELIDLSGRLCGVPRKVRRKRSEELIALVGLEHARNTRLKKYSKGMLQRAGIAQALVHDPDLIVFDEPMTGLDPVGRRDVRDIIQALGKRGKTVFFSSHILSDVETICDHIAIIARGKVRNSGALRDLVDPTIRGYTVVLAIDDGESSTVREKLAGLASDHGAAVLGLEESVRKVTMTLDKDADLYALLDGAHELGVALGSVAPIQDSLEDLFMAATRLADVTDVADSTAPGASAKAAAAGGAS